MTEDKLLNEYRKFSQTSRFAIEDMASQCRLDCVALDALVQGTACTLQAAGLSRGRALVYLGGQSPAAFACFWACVLRGGIFVPIDPCWPPARITAVCARLRPALVVAEVDLFAQCRQHLAGLPLLSVDELHAAPVAAAEQPVCMAESAPAAYLLTSGSTGEPKIVVLSRAALLRSAELVVQQFAWSSGERLLNLPEPHTMSGLRNAFLAAPLAGMTWLCVPAGQRSSIFSLLEVLQSRRVERLVAAPLLLRQINLLGERVSHAELASLRALYCTGADLHGGEVQSFHGRFGIPVINYYGLTETAGLCLGQQVSDWRADDRSLGKAVGCEVRIVDESGQLLPHGVVGQLQVCSPMAMSGYLGDAASTAELFDGQWLRTGDLARCDEQGRVHLAGRCSSFINTLSTEKVYPGEIEACLERQPEIAEAAVCGLRDAAGGERIAALLVLSPDVAGLPLDTRLFAERVRNDLGPARVPAQFRQVAQIPRSSNGKILRQQLVELFDVD